MFKPFSYSSEFVSIRRPLILSTEHKLQGKNIRAGSPDIFMSMVHTGFLKRNGTCINNCICAKVRIQLLFTIVR